MNTIGHTADTQDKYIIVHRTTNDDKTIYTVIEVLDQDDKIINRIYPYKLCNSDDCCLKIKVGSLVEKRQCNSIRFRCKFTGDSTNYVINISINELKFVSVLLVNGDRILAHHLHIKTGNTMCSNYDLGAPESVLDLYRYKPYFTPNYNYRNGIFLNTNNARKGFAGCGCVLI